jgi:hypothetical protein
LIAPSKEILISEVYIPTPPSFIPTVESCLDASFGFCYDGSMMKKPKLQPGDLIYLNDNCNGMCWKNGYYIVTKVNHEGIVLDRNFMYKINSFSTEWLDNFYYGLRDSISINYIMVL